MPSWSTFEAEAPELAATVRERLDAHKFKLLATVRRDGSPRISGIEIEFADDGEVLMGSMPDSVKGRDLDRDGRCCLHSVPPAEADWQGDAKLSGVAVAATGPTKGASYYRLDLHEVSTVAVGGDRLHLAVWTPERGVRRWSRK